MRISTGTRISLRVIALGYLFVLLAVPIAVILWRTFSPGIGEFGAVIMVSSGFPGVSQTLTLLVHSRYIDDHNTYGAYAAATLLMGIALVVLLLMTLLDRKRSDR